MEKMAEKTINKALHDTGFFKTLKPIEMMHVLISDIIARGDVKKDIFEYWITQEEHWPEISAEDRMDEVIRVLDSDNPTRALQGFQKVGFMAFCMPKCFPIRKLMDKKTFYLIIDHFDRLPIRKDDPAFKLAILMFSFDPARTEETLVDANFDPETINWICNLPYNYIEFIKLNNPKKLKHFVGKYGKDFYYDMNDYAWSVHAITKMNELKPLKSEEFVTRMIKMGVPLDTDDLAMTREDLIEAGAESEAEVFALQHILLDEAHRKPETNDKEWQLARVKKLSQREIDRKIRALEKEYTRI